jgi:hypothetical protein
MNAKTTMKNAAVMVGRLNPPTIGHYKVIDEMKKFIRENDDLKISKAFLILVEGKETSKDKEKNPLSAEDRKTFIEASGKANGIQILIASSAFDAFEKVKDQGYRIKAIAAGDDRADKYVSMVEKYFDSPNCEMIPNLERNNISPENLIHLTLDDINPSVASGSLARKAVDLDKEDIFAKIVGLEKKPKLSKNLFDKIKKSMG